MIVLAFLLAGCSGDAAAPLSPTPQPGRLLVTDLDEVALGQPFVVEVSVIDASGRAVNQSATPAVLSLVHSSGRVTETREAPVSGGFARFRDVQINEQGTYSVEVRHASLTGVGDPFDVFLPFLQLQAGLDFACGLADAHAHIDGTAVPPGVVYCWGDNQYGVVRPGSPGPPETRPVPVLGDIRQGPYALEIAAGYAHVCARLDTGSTVCWGSGEFGQITGAPGGAAEPITAIGSHRFLALVSGPTTVATCGKILPTVRGNTVCWGFNSSGSPDATLPEFFGPTTIGSRPGLGAFAMGSLHSCAIVAGETECRGFDGGALGGGAPSQMPGVTSVVSGGHAFTQVSVGWPYTCAIDDASQAWCWGSNALGNLGNGTDEHADVPVRVQGPSGVAFRTIRAGWTTTCAIDAEGFAHCWGWNDRGQSGTGSTQANLLVPTPVAGGHRFVDLAVGHVPSCGVTVSGRAYCWGKAAIGNGDPAGSPIPVPVG